MKKIHLICKTHLDMGFTDLASNVMNSYRTDFIPLAIQLANKLNRYGKRFVWTTGSWLIKDSLENASQTNKQNLIRAIKNGDIAWHALPFTTHTELLDKDTFNYGLDISRELDKQFGKTTISAKMTDVPGHTKAIIPMLAERGIKLLHIGVNESSAMPDVPTAFLWKNGDAEIIVLYEGSYGNIYSHPSVDDILYFIHSNDNHGPSNEQEINDIYARLSKDYKDYQITASTLDEYAKVLWNVRDKLPIITQEIGDSWIHGIATDSYKTGCFRELLSLKKQWVESGELSTNSKEYKDLSDNLLQVAEHTWGLDVKRHFSDFENYLKDEFELAREKDTVKLKRNLKNLYHKRVIAKYISQGVYNKGSYSKMELSWQEQREYIDNAIQALSDSRKEIAVKRIAKLRPNANFDTNGMQNLALDTPYKLGDYVFDFGRYGLKRLIHNKVVIMDGSDIATVSYRAYGDSDYKFWWHNYSRNHKATREWSQPDFLRPGLKQYDRKYLTGSYSYEISDIFTNDDNIIVKMSIANELYTKQGAPKHVAIKYSLDNDNGLIIEVIWLDKQATRLTEAIFCNFPIISTNAQVRYVKMGDIIDPFDIVVNGNRNLSAVEGVEFVCSDEKYLIKNTHAPLVSIGRGKILEFDNAYENVAKDGVSFNLYNNVWGTNFPLWYKDNAYFKFSIKKLDK